MVGQSNEVQVDPNQKRDENVNPLIKQSSYSLFGSNAVFHTQLSNGNNNESIHPHENIIKKLKNKKKKLKKRLKEKPSLWTKKYNTMYMKEKKKVGVSEDFYSSSCSSLEGDSYASATGSLEALKFLDELSVEELRDITTINLDTLKKNESEELDTNIDNDDELIKEDQSIDKEKKEEEEVLPFPEQESPELNDQEIQVNNNLNDQVSDIPKKTSLNYNEIEKYPLNKSLKEKLAISKSASTNFLDKEMDINQNLNSSNISDSKLLKGILSVFQLLV